MKKFPAIFFGFALLLSLSGCSHYNSSTSYYKKTKTVKKCNGNKGVMTNMGGVL